MPSFKPKAIKKLPIVNNTASTLDSTHDSKLEEFNKNENEIFLSKNYRYGCDK